ncbi:MAG TPA: hypothetical protein VIH57_12365 [Bacteroidales bacterium]
MNPNYSPAQQKIYSDYSSKTDEQLLEILKSENKYLGSVIDIVSDILNDRSALPEDRKENYNKEKENNENSLDSLLGESYREEARNNMVYGGIIGAIGITVTLVTYFAAYNGGIYVIAWGAIITGVYKFFKGLSDYAG